MIDTTSSPIGIGRILTNPPSHTTQQAGPHWAVPRKSLEIKSSFESLTPRAGYEVMRRSS
jgi:hypothetical protein